MAIHAAIGKFPQMTRSGRHVGSVRVPVETALTCRVLLAAVRKLRTIDIEEVVDALVSELDSRLGDPEMEAEPLEDDE